MERSVRIRLVSLVASLALGVFMPVARTAGVGPRNVTPTAPVRGRHVVAGVFGAVTLKAPKTLALQTAPALIAVVLVWMTGR